MRSVDPLPRFANGVVLRRLGAADLPAFQAYRRDREVGQYQGWSPTSDAEAMVFLTEMSTIALFEPGKWCQIGIAEPGSLCLIGDIGLYLSHDGYHAEIGFTLRPQSQGLGLGTAAVREAVKFVFAQTGVDRVLGITDERNAPSIRLLERIGMRMGESRSATFRGEPCVERVYVISRHDG
jgi:RimJ/RimL family protein N-acetyltransferase